MSLSKSYQVGCDGNSLAIRRNLIDKIDPVTTRTERAQMRTGCLYYSLREYSAKNARAQAKRAGWIRHLEEFHGAQVPFDICPECAPQVIPDHLPKSWKSTCRYCKDPLTWEPEPGGWGNANQCAMSHDSRHHPGA